MTNKSQHLPWLWDCSSLCPHCQRAASSPLLNFYWCLTMLASVQSLNLTLKTVREHQGEMNQRPNHLTEGFLGRSLFRTCLYSGYFPPEHFWVAGCSKGWSLFAVLSCIWHTHKNFFCLSVQARNTALLTFLFTPLFFFLESCCGKGSFLALIKCLECALFVSGLCIWRGFTSHNLIFSYRFTVEGIAVRKCFKKSKLDRNLGLRYLNNKNWTFS